MTEKQYTKAEAYEFLIENPEIPVYFRFCNDEGNHWVKYNCDRMECKFHRRYSWDEKHHGVHFTLFEDGPFYETPEPPKTPEPPTPEPEYELPKSLTAVELYKLWEGDGDVDVCLQELARRILIQARKDAAEMIAEAMLSKGAT